MNGHLAVVKYLIERGTDIHAYEDAALRYSSMNGYLEVVQYLIEHGANIHADEDAALRMRISVESNDIDMIEYIIRHDIIDPTFTLCVYNSKEDKHLDIIQYLVDHGADIHADHEYALCISALSGKLDVVKYLVKCGADVNANDSVVLRYAVDNSH
jgi:ankyrin repeat protein